MNQGRLNELATYVINLVIYLLHSYLPQPEKNPSSLVIIVQKLVVTLVIEGEMKEEK